MQRSLHSMMPPRRRKRVTNGAITGTCSAKSIQGSRKRKEVNSYPEKSLPTSQGPTERTESSRLPPLYKPKDSLLKIVEEGRHLTGIVAARLEDIHPNPGPRRGMTRVKTPEAKKARRERRYELISVSQPLSSHFQAQQMLKQA